MKKKKKNKKTGLLIFILILDLIAMSVFYLDDKYAIIDKAAMWIDSMIPTTTTSLSIYSRSKKTTTATSSSTSSKDLTNSNESTNSTDRTSSSSKETTKSTTTEPPIDYPIYISYVTPFDRDTLEDFGSNDLSSWTWVENEGFYDTIQIEIESYDELKALQSPVIIIEGFGKLEWEMTEKNIRKTLDDITVFGYLSDDPSFYTDYTIAKGFGYTYDEIRDVYEANIDFNDSDPTILDKIIPKYNSYGDFSVTKLYTDKACTNEIVDSDIKTDNTNTSKSYYLKISGASEYGKNYSKVLEFHITRTKLYNVTLALKGYEVSVSLDEYPDGTIPETQQITNLTNSGYTIIAKMLPEGYNLAINLKGAINIGYTFDESNLVSSLNSDIVATINFYPTEYQISYIMNSGTKVDDSKYISTYNITEEVVLPTIDDISRIGHTFAGWYSDSTYTTLVTKIEEGTTDNKTFYAKFDPIKYNIEYDYGTTLLLNNPTNYYYEDVVNLTPSYKGGYEFLRYDLYNGDELIKQNFVSGSKFDYTYETITVKAVYKSNFENVLTDGYIYYGEYPQTVVTNTSLLNQLNSKSPSPDGYIHIDEDKYIKVTAKPMLSGVYFNDNVTVCNKDESYYFKVEPIKWLLVSNKENEFIFISDLVLYADKYGSSNDYDTSYIKSKVEELYEIMFDLAEKESILENTYNVNDKEITSRVFVPCKDMYDDDNRDAKASDYAIALGCSFYIINHYASYYYSDPGINTSSLIYYPNREKDLYTKPTYLSGYRLMIKAFRGE